MSATIDWMPCPNCGNENAYYEQDNRTCETFLSCGKCGYYRARKRENSLYWNETRDNKSGGKEMKATMLEFLNENNAWTWFAVYKSKTPRQAIKEYIKDHLAPEDVEEAIKGIAKESDGSIHCEEARAYYINIE